MTSGDARHSREHGLFVKVVGEVVLGARETGTERVPAVADEELVRCIERHVFT
jgi:hypothetical protein